MVLYRSPEINLVVLECPILYTIQSFKYIGQSVPKKKVLKGFYHIWEWWPSWSRDQNSLSIHYFLHLKVNLHDEIWLSLAQRFRRSLKMLMDDGRRMDWTKVKNDLYLWHTYIFMYSLFNSFSCHILQWCLSNPPFKHFLLQTYKEPKLTFV